MVVGVTNEESTEYSVLSAQPGFGLLATGY